jgi:hypothetical protein
MKFALWMQQYAPPWLQQQYGAEFLTALGQFLDGAAPTTIAAPGDPVAGIPSQAVIQQAVQARFPSFAPVPPAGPGVNAGLNGLTLLGKERKMSQGLFQTTASFRTQVLQAWNYWTHAGTPTGVLSALWNLGYQNRIYFLTSQGQISYLSDGPNSALVTVNPENGVFSMQPVGARGGPWPATNAQAPLKPGEPWHWWALFMNWKDGLPGLPTAPAWAANLPAAGGQEMGTILETIADWTPGFTNFFGLIVLTDGGPGLMNEWDPNATTPYNRPNSFYTGMTNAEMAGGQITVYGGLE